MKNKLFLTLPVIALVFLLPMISALGTTIVKKQSGDILYVNAKTDITTKMNVLYFNHYENQPFLSSGTLLVSGIDSNGKAVIVNLRLREKTVTETSTKITITNQAFGSLQINGLYKPVTTETVTLVINKATGITTATGIGNVKFQVTGMI